jgi:hypothetical protein
VITAIQIYQRAKLMGRLRQDDHKFEVSLGYIDPVPEKQKAKYAKKRLDIKCFL